MGYLISLNEIADRSTRQQYLERGIPERLAGFSSSVLAVLLKDHPDCDRIVASVGAMESRREIQKEHQYERVLRSLAGRQEVKAAMDAAPDRLSEAVREGELKDADLLQEELPVVTKLLLACGDGVDTAFRDRECLKTNNEHAILHNLFRRTALRDLQEREIAQRQARRGRDDQDDASDTENN